MPTSPKLTYGRTGAASHARNLGENFDSGFCFSAKAAILRKTVQESLFSSDLFEVASIEQAEVG